MQYSKTHSPKPVVSLTSTEYVYFNTVLLLQYYFGPNAIIFLQHITITPAILLLENNTFLQQYFYFNTFTPTHLLQMNTVTPKQYFYSNTVLLLQHNTFTPTQFFSNTTILLQHSTIVPTQYFYSNTLPTVSPCKLSSLCKICKIHYFN